jgi:hypothetical protein
MTQYCSGYLCVGSVNLNVSRLQSPIKTMLTINRPSRHWKPSSTNLAPYSAKLVRLLLYKTMYTMNNAGTVAMQCRGNSSSLAPLA